MINCGHARESYRPRINNMKTRLLSEDMPDHEDGSSLRGVRVLRRGHGRAHGDRRVPHRRPQSVLPTPRGGNMDNTTLLIILIVVIIVLGGGWYGRGRWY